MKKEATKKSKWWLWLLIGLIALVAIAGVVVGAILIIGGGSKNDGPKGGRPELYWNIDRAAYTQNSESGLSTREPGEDGVYRVRFAYNGEQLELQIADKQLVNFIDTMDIMGLTFDADGVVVDVIDPEEICVPVAQNAYVQQVMSDRIIANSSIAMNGMQYTIEFTDLTEIYDVSTTADVAGEKIDATKFMPMDSIWVYANDLEEVTHIYMTDHPVSSPVYWRAYQMWNSAEKSTSRVPDENGVYSIDFCSEGEIVTLKCKDKSIVTSIDNKSPHSCHFGFVFDEDGYIIDIMNSGIGIRGAVAAERIEVQELDGNYFSGTQLIPSDGGLSYSATLPEDCIIYDASSGAARNGVQGERVDSLKLGDRICVWTDPVGTPKLVYIANRLQDVPAYFNIERKYDNTLKATTREPDWAGYYSFDLVETGKTGKVTLKTKDKELATFIDSIANRIVGLKVNNGIIENAYTDDDVVGWTSIYGGYVPQIQGAIVSLVSFSKPDSPSNVLMGANAKYYDVSGKDVPYGTETTLRVGDIATVTRDVSYNGVNVYITRRMVGGDKVYYNLDYQYNSTTKETKRLPNEEGYYVFTMAHNGKQTEVKTKSKALADKIEKSMSGDLVCVMRVVDGVVYELYETAAAYGQSLYSGWRVSAINGDGTYTVMNASGGEKVLKMADDCIIYNTSTVYDSHRGERIYSLQVGDMVTSLADYKSNVKMIYVRYRAVDKMYANPMPMYDAANKTTLREPDADGWYWFDLSQEGVMKRFKTNDVAIATLVDSYQKNPFGLRIKDDVILNVVAANWVRGVYKAGVTAWDVTSVKGNSASIKFNKPGYSTTGDTKNIYVGGNVKVYDISPTAEVFGQPVKLKAGDRIRTYVDRKDNCVYVFVTHHDTRVHGSYGYCEHCDQEVFWHPWAGESWDGMDCHYYVCGDLKLTKQTNIGNDSKEYEIVLDLNGKTVEVNGARAFLVFRGDDMSILDSVGGGEIKGTGTEGGNGGTILLGGESTLNLYGGTLSFIDSDIHVFKGAVLYADTGCTFNMYAGTIKDGIVNSPTKNVQGGNIYLYGSTMNLYDGVVEGGRAERTDGLQPAVAAQGGNIYALRGAVLNLYGGEIRNGYSNQHGGNLFLSYTTLNMTGGKVIGGECVYSGGNFYSQFDTVANISGGTIENGNAGAFGNNIYAAHATGEMHISGGLITGDVYMSAAKVFEISGKAKITSGEVFGLSLPTTLDLTLDELKSGAEICVNAKGAFSLANPKAQSYVDAGYIKPGAPRTSIRVENNIMYMEGELSHCEHCGQYVEWSEWLGTTSPASGHYFIAKDVKQASQLTIAKDTDVVLDLYGNTYSSENIRNFLVRGTLSIMDSVGGGEMITTGGEEFAGAIALVGTESGSVKPAGFNLYSGTLKLADDHPTFNNGGLIMFSSNGELNMYGGTMIGGYVAQRGGCVNLNTTGGTMNIYGGTIKGGSAGISGGCLDISGTLNVEGGIIAGEVFIEPSCRGLNLSGSPVIDLLNISSGIRANIEALVDGANIAVNASGTFTYAVDNVAAYVPYFKLADGVDGAIRISASALTVGMSDEQLNDKNSVYANAVQMTADGVFNAGGTVTAMCPACGSEVQWVDLADVPAGSINEDTHYYLSRDIEIDRHYGCFANVCVHLNGHNVTSSARAFYVDATSTTCWTLNIMGDGTVTGAGVAHDTIPRGTLDVGGSVNFYGGTYVATGNYPALTGRGYYGRSVINVYEGTEFQGKNVSILARTQVVNMYGGTVTSGTIKVDGAGTCEINLNNVTVSNSNSGQSVISAAGEKGILSINGSVVDGSVIAGSNLKTLMISGKSVIKELNVGSGCLVTLFDLQAGTDIAVVANGAFTTPNNDASNYLDAGYIRAFAPTNNLYEDDNVLYMEVEKVYCEHCGMDVVWSLWPGHTSPLSGHYYIADDYFGQTGQFSIAQGTDVVIDLMGNTYSTTGIRNFLVRGTLSIVDTVGGGEMVVSGDPAGYGTIAMVSTASGAETPAVFNLYSGTLRMADEHASVARGGMLILTGDAIMNMYGGTICNGVATERGGNICVEGVSSRFNMYGGEILGGAAPNGGSICVLGSFNMEGGMIEGQVSVTSSASDVVVSGSVEIGELNVTDGKTVNAEGLVTGSKINVVANGVFTEALTDADSYLPYFEAVDSGYCVVVEGNALSVVLKPKEENPLNKVHEQAEKMTADDVFASGGTVTAVCPVCGTEEQWVDLATVSKATSIKAADGNHFYLSSDHDVTTYYGFYTDACLHLNGHDITSSTRAIYVDATSTTCWTLNIMGEGTVSGAGLDHATIPRGTLDIGGTVNLFGGHYVATGDKNPVMTARGYAGRSTTNIYDGATISSPGVNLLLRSHDVNMYGGELLTGYVKIDGASACSFNLYGGTITNGNVDQDAAVVASGAKGQLKIDGGTVNGTVKIDATLGSVTVSGAPVVENLDLTSGKLLTVGELTGGEVLVSAEGVFTPALPNAADYLYYIGAADAGYDVVVENDALAIQESPMVKGNKVHEVAEKMTADGVFASGADVTAVCPVCETEVTWQNLNVVAATQNKLSAGHYYLSADLDRTTHFSLTVDACIHLNGYNITSSARVLYVEYSTVNIMGEGILTGGYNDPNNRGFAATLDAPGNVNLYGGTYKATTACPIVASRSNKDHCITMYDGASIVRDASVPGLNVRVYDEGDFTMYGGLISGGSGTEGGNVLVKANVASHIPAFSIYGGVIENGTATTGGNIYSTGASAIVNICGGTIRNGEVYIGANAAGVTVSGAPVVSELNLTGGKLLTLGILRMNADITVNAADGVFTEANSRAAAYQTLFKAVKTEKQISVSGNALAIVNAN